MAKTRRKKKQTHVVPGQDPSASKVPRSFVFSRGRLGPALQQLQKDLRRLMRPHTAKHLKVSKRNNLKDIVSVAGPLGVSHLLMLSATEQSPYLRIAKSPRGPTLTFRIHSFSLSRDVLGAQNKPRAPPAIFQTPPLVVIHNFQPELEHLKLTTVMFQNLFPALQVEKVKLAECQRVLLLHYDRELKRIELRHYSVTAAPTGVNRSIRKLVQRRIPDLGGLDDVAEFVTRPGYGSESEGEDEASKVTLPQRAPGRGNMPSAQSAVRLHEVGPRLQLQLVKAEEGLCAGAVLYHAYVEKTPEEAALLEARVEERAALKAQRRAQQEANVELKKKRKVSFQEPEAEEGAEEGAPSVDPAAEEDDDDREYFRQEVGEEPDEGFVAGLSTGARRTRHVHVRMGSGRGRGGRGSRGGRGRGRGMPMREKRDRPE